MKLARVVGMTVLTLGVIFAWSAFADELSDVLAKGESAKANVGKDNKQVAGDLNAVADIVAKVGKEGAAEFLPLAQMVETELRDDAKAFEGGSPLSAARVEDVGERGAFYVGVIRYVALGREEVGQAKAYVDKVTSDFPAEKLPEGVRRPPGPPEGAEMLNLMLANLEGAPLTPAQNAETAKALLTIRAVGLRLQKAGGYLGAGKSAEAAQELEKVAAYLTVHAERVDASVKEQVIAVRDEVTKAAETVKAGTLSKPEELWPIKNKANSAAGLK